MQKIQVRMIIEILGRPPEHIKEALTTLVLRLGSEKGVKLLEKTIHEPNPVKDSDLFTTFAEILIEVEEISSVFGLLFTYMPAHVEIVNPEKLSLSNSDFNDLTNRIVARLHDYDAITKKLLHERDMAIRKIKEIAPEIIAEDPTAPLVQKQATKDKKPLKKKKSQ